MSYDEKNDADTVEELEVLPEDPRGENAGREPSMWASLERWGDGPNGAFLWRVIRCPHCGGEHVHGGGPLAGNPRDLLNYRTAHCGRGGYTLECHFDDADVVRGWEIAPDEPEGAR